MIVPTLKYPMKSQHLKSLAFFIFFSGSKTFSQKIKAPFDRVRPNMKYQETTWRLPKIAPLFPSLMPEIFELVGQSSMSWPAVILKPSATRPMVRVLGLDRTLYIDINKLRPCAFTASSNLSPALTQKHSSALDEARKLQGTKVPSVPAPDVSVAAGIMYDMIKSRSRCLPPPVEKKVTQKKKRTKVVGGISIDAITTMAFHIASEPSACFDNYEEILDAARERLQLKAVNPKTDPTTLHAARVTYIGKMVSVPYKMEINGVCTSQQDYVGRVMDIQRAKRQAFSVTIFFEKNEKNEKNETVVLHLVASDLKALKLVE